MTYEPPGGLTEFVRMLRRVPEPEAIELLRMAFDNAVSATILDDVRLLTRKAEEHTRDNGVPDPPALVPVPPFRKE
ncbi:MAG TPA: hypothetical protein VGR63_13095 [Casimicrobiaceae bacterium]|jgi:hypothetical protein|nr:hypothetical protein [Casimicrobiaceae bacterium]